MRTVKFTEVGMVNYGPYKEPMILPIKDNSIVLIVGQNGVGKTMLIDAIPYTLFGTTSKEMKGDDVVNNVVGKDCHTWVELETEGSQYRVDRYQKYRKIGNSVTLKKDGTIIKTGQTEVLPEIEKIVCSYKMFMNTRMFGQKVKDFFTDLVDSKKKEIFRKILNLDKYTDYYDETNRRIKEVETANQENKKNFAICQAMIAEAENNINILKEKELIFIAEKQKRIDVVNREIEKIHEEIVEQQKLLESIEKEMKQIVYDDDMIETLKIKQNTIENELQTKKKEIESLKNQKLSELKVKGQQKKMEFIQIKQTKELELQKASELLKQNLRDSVKPIEDYINKLHLKTAELKVNIKSNLIRADEITKNVIESKDSKCPLCETEVVGETRTLLENKILEYKHNAEHLEKDVEMLKKDEQEQLPKIADKKLKAEEEMKELKKHFIEETSKLSEEIQSIDSKLYELIKRVEETARQQYNSAIEENTNALKENNVVLSVAMEAKQQYSLLENRKNILVKNIDTLTNKVVYNKKVIETIENEQFDTSQIERHQKHKIGNILKLKEMTNITEKQEKFGEILEFWKQAFSPSGIPSMLIDESIPFMNSTITEILDSISNGRYVVSFDTLSTTKSGEYRDKISVNVLDTVTRANTRTQLSGGQTRMIDIATILTLGELQSKVQMVKFNILLFDEIFDSLDEENIGNVSKMLSKLKNGRIIVIISHKHPDQLEADETISLR
jgi:DNA repair exonuclease SbcCD ATPase subunit